MAAGWLCIGDKPLHFVIHFLGDAGLQHADIEAKCAGRVVCLPPFRDVNQVAERLHHAAHCANRSLVRMDKPRRADHFPLCVLRPALIPPVDGKRPRQPRQQVCRAVVGTLETAQGYGRVFDFSAGARRRDLKWRGAHRQQAGITHRYPRSSRCTRCTMTPACH